MSNEQDKLINSPKYLEKEDTPKQEDEKKAKKVPIEDWVNNWLSKNNAKYNMRRNTVSINGKIHPLGYIHSRIILAADRAGYKGKSELIKHTLQIWIPDQREQKRNEVFEKIKYDPQLTDEPIRKFIRMMTGRDDQLDMAVLRHFIWQTKRKITGKKVEHHMMPIFYGKTGVGKTEAIKKFLGPIHEIYKSPNDMTIVGDERSTKILSDCYCLFFDEMAHVGKVNVDRLKNVISNNEGTYREMRTNENPSVLNNCTFIGATNNPLQELIYDPTSMRRFWQIEVSSHLKLNWDQINSINYFRLWQSVNLEEECPIQQHLLKISEHQTLEYRRHFPLEEFLINHCDPLPEDTEIGKWHDSNWLYTQFKKWLQWQNKGNLVPGIDKFRNSFGKFKVGTESTTKVFYEVDGIKYMKKRVNLNEGDKKRSTYIYNIEPKKYNYD